MSVCGRPCFPNSVVVTDRVSWVPPRSLCTIALRVVCVFVCVRACVCGSCVLLQRQRFHRLGFLDMTRFLQGFIFPKSTRPDKTLVATQRLNFTNTANRQQKCFFPARRATPYKHLPHHTRNPRKKSEATHVFSVSCSKNAFDGVETISRPQIPFAFKGPRRGTRYEGLVRLGRG